MKFCPIDSSLGVYLLLPFLFLVNIGWTQLPIAWDAGIFGDKYDEFTDAVEFPTGGFVLGGLTYSSSGPDITDTPQGNGDFFLVKTDTNGIREWAHLYGGTEVDRMTSVDLTPTNDIVCVGHSNSNIGGDKTSDVIGANDYWIIKTNDKGDLLWDKTFGGSEDDRPYSVKVMPSGEIFVLGFSNSPISGNKTAPNHGGNDFWLIKLDPNGNKLWDKTYGGAGDERLYYGALALTNDGNLIIGGSSDSGVSAMKSKPNYGGMDFWVIKIDPNGQILWENSFGGLEEEQAQDIIPTHDGGFLVGGGTRSDASGSKNSDFQGLIDFWLVRLDADGNLMWEKSYGGSGLEVITGLAENVAGNILIGGLSDSPIEGTKTAPNIGDYDYWLMFLDQNGNEIWQETYGGTGKDALTVLLKTADGGYFVGGDSGSGTGGYKTTSNYGFNDFWFFKLECGWDYEPDYDFTGCEGEDLILDLSGEDCPSCTFTWPDETAGATYTYTDDMPFGEKFEVIVSAAEGCPLTKEVQVTFRENPRFSLGNDTTVYQNTKYILRPKPDIKNASYHWSNGDTTLTSLVTQTGTYGLTIGIDGCETYEEVSIQFKGNKSIFMPTVFSPNNDGVNDIFRIYGDDAVKNINQFSIFDRWGGQVFGLTDFLPGDNSMGWDGSFRGKNLREGVYIYFLEVEYTDGSKEWVKGDVTLFR